MRHLADLLLENHRAGKPLLTGATLYRGTPIPDQSAVSRNSLLLHTSLSIAVADKYALQHFQGIGDKKTPHYIGTYDLHRGARFHSDMGGESLRHGISVEDMESRLLKIVEAHENSTSKSVNALRMDVENFVEKNCHEVMIPARDEKGQPTRPTTLYEVEHGKIPDGERYRQTFEIMAGSREITTPEQIAAAKQAMLRNAICPAERAIVDSFKKTEADRLDPTSIANLERAHEALREMIIEKREQELARHMNLPLNEFMSAARSTPVSPRREEIAALGAELIQRVAAGDRVAQQEAARIKNLPRESAGHDIKRVAAYARGETPAPAAQQVAQRVSPESHPETQKMSWAERSNPDRVNALFEKAFAIARERDAAAARPVFDKTANEFARGAAEASPDRGGPSLERSMDFRH